MNLETLKKDKENLEQQLKQLEAQFNQVVGAIAWVNKQITELEKEDSNEIEKTEENK